jgi:hypothetical protein
MDSIKLKWNIWIWIAIIFVSFTAQDEIKKINSQYYVKHGTNGFHFQTVCPSGFSPET